MRVCVRARVVRLKLPRQNNSAEFTPRQQRRSRGRGERNTLTRQRQHDLADLRRRRGQERVAGVAAVVQETCEQRRLVLGGGAAGRCALAGVGVELARRRCGRQRALCLFSAKKMLLLLCESGRTFFSLDQHMHSCFCPAASSVFHGRPSPKQKSCLERPQTRCRLRRHRRAARVDAPSTHSLKSEPPLSPPAA